MNILKMKIFKKSLTNLSFYLINNYQYKLEVAMTKTNTKVLLSLFFLLSFSLTFSQSFFRIGEIPLPPPQNSSFGQMISGMDIDGDGRPEIYAVNNNWNDTGAELIPAIFKFEYNPFTQDWEQVWTTVLNIPKQNTWPALTTGDWDNDGKEEVIWGPVNFLETGNLNPARVVVFETPGDGSDIMGLSDGMGGYLPNAEWTITSNDNQNLRPIRWELVDIDNDGTKELVYASRVNAAGPGNIFGIISVDDIPDYGGGLETWTLEFSGNGTSVSTNTIYDMAVMDSTLYLFHTNGDVTPVTYSSGVWTVNPALVGLVPGGSWLSASVVDLNNDATKEIVVAGNGATNKKVYLLQGSDAVLTATEIANMSSLIGAGTTPRLYGGHFGDIDDDNNLDFAFGSRDATPNASIVRLEYQGGDITLPASYSTSLIDSSFATGGRWALVNIADVDGDGFSEVLYSEMTGSLAPIIITDETGFLPPVPLYSTLWQRAEPTGNAPTWFSTTGNTERGFAYGNVGGNDRVYVVSRNGGTFVKILDAATGADVGDLDVTGISGGTFPVNDIGVTSDGKIIASNLLTAAGDFKLYSWDTEASAPVNFLTYTTSVTVRLGDKITVVGDYAAGTAQIWAASATTGVVYKWTMSGGVFNTVPTIITLSDAPAPAVIGSAGVGPLPNGDFYWSGNGSNVQKYSSTGTLLGSVPGTVVATGSNISRYLGTVGVNEYLAVFAYGTGNGNARILEIPNGVPGDATLYAATPSLQVNANGNGVGDVDFKVNPDFSATIFVLCTNNGLGAYTTTDVIVPVELSTFSATVNNENVVLNWTTESELNNQGFEVQRRSFEGQFITIGHVNGNGTTSERKHYSFTDVSLEKGKYFYRLKQIDFNGSYEFSNEVFAEIVGTPKEFALFQNYPNPFNPATMINFQTAAPVNVNLTVFNMLGEEVAILINNQFTEAGQHSVRFDGSNLASGTYIYRLTAGDFVQTKKMMLTK